MDLTQFAGQSAGSKGIFMIVPVVDGDPGLTLTQQAQVVIPTGSTNAGIGLWARSTASGMALVIGLTNVPLPQPGGGETIDLSGTSAFYAPFDAITALGLTLNGLEPQTLTLSRNFTDSELLIRRKHETPIVVPKTSQWLTGSTGSPYPVTGDGFPAAIVLEKRGSGTTTYANEQITLSKGTYLETPSGA
jgi:hypothetical protein